MDTSHERSFSSVLQDIIGNVQEIIRSEVRLAKAEVQQEAAKAGKAAGVLGSGAVLGLYAGGFLLLACLYALELVVAAWLAALIVAVVAGAGAAVLVNAGKKRVKRVDPRPDKTIHSIQENLEWAKNQTK
jgi:hypothetical protein